MNLIETMLGIYPDGGSGVAELTLGFVLVLVAATRGLVSRAIAGYRGW